MNRGIKKVPNAPAAFELREPAVAYMAGRPPVEPWMAGVAYGESAADDDRDCELTDEELDNIDIPGLSIRSWDDFRSKLEEGAADIAAGRVTPHKKVFHDLLTKIKGDAIVGVATGRIKPPPQFFWDELEREIEDCRV